jgi:hypothetical protein
MTRFPSLSACAPLLAVAMGVSAVLLLLGPAPSAYTLAGFSLPIDQRDVRVFNNFADASANDNQTPDPSFPGALGAPLACWKAVVEWGSALHGDGGGDPSQPGDLGSGGANFDVTWQGLADGVGGLNDNVISAAASLGGGVLAVVESPGADGWRIRLSELVEWSDGPGAPEPGQLDLQGIVAHEYGLALGLAYSTVAGATMYPALLGNGYAARSIAADDSAGVQAAYGAASPAKPVIAGAVVGAGDVVTITGSGFALAANEVWFTRAGVHATGDPVTVLGVASSGSTIVVAAPAEAGPGDVLVKIPGSGAASLSNAWPVDLVPPAPDASELSPASVPAIAADGPVAVELSGAYLDTVTSLSIGGIALTKGIDWSFAASGEITFSMPQVGQLGSVDVAVAGPGGADVIQITVEACDPPVLDADPSEPALLANGATQGFTAASEVGDLVFVIGADNDLPSIVPGILSVGLGDGLTDFFVIAQGVVPAQGWIAWTFPVSGLPAGASFFSAVVAFPGEGADLLEASDPVQHTVVAP